MIAAVKVAAAAAHWLKLLRLLHVQFRLILSIHARDFPLPTLL